MTTLQKVDAAYAQTHGKPVLAQQIRALRGLFTPHGLHTIARTRDGVAYRVDVETLYALVETMPAQHYWTFIRILASIWHEAVNSVQARRNVEQTLITLAVRIIENYSEGETI
jgi:hypothetical protein